MDKKEQLKGKGYVYTGVFILIAIVTIVLAIGFLALLYLIFRNA